MVSGRSNTRAEWRCHPRPCRGLETWMHRRIRKRRTLYRSFCPSCIAGSPRRSQRAVCACSIASVAGQTPLCHCCPHYRPSLLWDNPVQGLDWHNWCPRTTAPTSNMIPYYTFLGGKRLLLVYNVNLANDDSPQGRFCQTPIDEEKITPSTIIMNSYPAAERLNMFQMSKRKRVWVIASCIYDTCGPYKRSSTYIPFDSSTCSIRSKPGTRTIGNL